MWQISASRQYGARLNLQPLQHPTGVFHVMAVKAAAYLTRAAGDSAFRQACKDALAGGQGSLDNVLWVRKRREWSALRCCPECQRIHQGRLSARASSAGLGSVLASEERLLQHTDREGTSNVTPFSLGKTDESTWMGASSSWATLSWQLCPQRPRR